MRTRVDFYLTLASTQTEKLQFVCRLLEKAYKQKHHVFVYCEDEQQTHTLDELLWTFKDISFIPHNIIGEGPTPPPSIQLGYLDIPTHHKDILLNLTPSIPDNPNQFKRVIEIIDEEPLKKEIARENYKRYRENNYQLHLHDLTK